MIVDTWFNRQSLKSLFAITAILFLVFGFLAGFMAGTELEFEHGQDEIEKAAASELGLILFDNNYYHVSKQNPFELFNSSDISNLTIIGGN